MQTSTSAQILDFWKDNQLSSSVARVLLLALALTGLQLLHAQETPFARAISSQELTTEELASIGMDGQNLGDTLEFVRFQALPTAPTSDGLTFALDDSSAPFAFDVQFYDSEHGADFRLAGELAGQTFYFTYDTITGYGGSGTIGTSRPVTGEIVASSAVHHIHSR